MFPSGFITNSTGWIDQMNTRLFRVFSHLQCEKLSQKGLSKIPSPVIGVNTEQALHQCVRLKTNLQKYWSV